MFRAFVSDKPHEEDKNKRFMYCTNILTEWPVETKKFSTRFGCLLAGYKWLYRIKQTTVVITHCYSLLTQIRCAKLVIDWYERSQIDWMFLESNQTWVITRFWIQ